MLYWAVLPSATHTSHKSQLQCQLFHFYPGPAKAPGEADNATVISVSAKHVEDLNRTLALGITLVQQTGVAMAVIWGANQHWEAVIVCLFIGCSSN